MKAHAYLRRNKISQLQREGAVPAGDGIDEMNPSYLNLPCSLARPGVSPAAPE